MAQKGHGADPKISSIYPFGCRRLRLIVDVLEDVAWLALQGVADGLEGREPHRLGFARIEDGQIRQGHANRLRQVREGHLAIQEHPVKVDFDTHDHTVNSDSS